MGYFVVRSAGSHGPADLVVIFPGGAFLIQCKVKLELNYREEKELKKLAHSLGATPLYFTRDEHGHLVWEPVLEVYTE